MKDKRQTLRILRHCGLMQVTDYFRYIWIRARNRKSNRGFRSRFSGVVFPPDYMMYEAYRLDYERYYINGMQSAEWLVEKVKPYVDLEKASILDWGCGPARVLRHMPGLLPAATFYGTDYNPATIAWCSKTFSNIYFHSNDLMPRLVYEKGMFDLVYGISIFTHLSEEAHEAWIGELGRILKPGGILLITLHGASFRDKLTGDEQLLFDRGELVVRGNVKEGHRTFTAFHPQSWVRKWTEGFEILKYEQGRKEEQDTLILKEKGGRRKEEGDR